MFKKINRYIAAHIIASTLLVLLALLSIDFLVRLIDDTDHLGEKDFTLSRLLLISFYFTPVKLQLFFPLSLVIGALLGLGKMQASNELTVMQISGVSKFHLSLLGIGITLIMGTTVLAITEYAGYPLNKQASILRASSLGRNVRNISNTGAWILDNNHFVHIGGIKKTGEIRNIKIYQMAENMQLQKVIKAQTASTAQGQWTLKQVDTLSDFTKKINKKHEKQQVWKNTIDTKIVELLISDAEDLSTRELSQYIAYQQANGIAPANHMLIFWQRLFMPLSAAVMFLLALPFVFGDHRSKSQGKKLFIGLLLGIAYYVSASSISNVILLTGTQPILGALLPILLFTSITLGLLWWKK